MYNDEGLPLLTMTVKALTVVLYGQCVIVLTVEFIGKQSV